MKKLIENIYDAIGETPMLRLGRITDHYGVEGNIFAKLEYLSVSPREQMFVLLLNY